MSIVIKVFAFIGFVTVIFFIITLVIYAIDMLKGKLMYRCKKCNKRLKKGEDNFCSRCGERVEV